MAKIYQHSLSTIIPHGEKNRDLLDLQNQTLSGEDTTWMVDLLKIRRLVECFFLPNY